MRFFKYIYSCCHNKFNQLTANEMGQCQCPTTINHTQQTIPNYTILTNKIYEGETSIELLEGTIKPLVNDLIDFLRDNWIRIPYVLSIIEEKVENTQKEKDVHCSLYALVGIIKLIKKKIESQSVNRQEYESGREELKAPPSEKSLSITRTRTQSNFKRSQPLSTLNIDQQIAQQMAILQYKVIRCLAIIQENNISILPFFLYKQLLEEFCPLLTTPDKKLLPIVDLIQELLVKYLINKISDKIDQLPGPLMNVVKMRKKKRTILRMLSKEEKLRDSSIDGIAADWNQAVCLDVVELYYILISFVESNRKAFDITTLFINEDQRLVLQILIYLKIQNDSIGDEYMEEFLDLFHKKAVKIKQFQELFETIFMKFDPALWEDQSIIVDLFGLLLKSAHYQDIKDDHELYILGSLFNYLETTLEVEVSPTIIATVLRCIELFLADLGYGEFLSYQVSTNFPMLMDLYCKQKDAPQPIQSLVLQWFKLIEELDHVFFNYICLILDKLLEIIEKESKNSIKLKDIVVLMQLTMKILQNREDNQIQSPLPEEIIFRLFEIAKYPSFEVQTLVMQNIKCLIVDKGCLISPESLTIFLCSYWILEIQNSVSRQAFNELSLKSFFEITNKLQEQEQYDLIISGFVRYIMSNLNHSRQGTKQLCSLIIFIILDKHQEVTKQMRLSRTVVGSRLHHPIQLSYIKKLLKQDIEVSQQQVLKFVENSPNEEMFRFASNRIGMKSNYKVESVGSVQILHNHDTISNRQQSYETFPRSNLLSRMYSKTDIQNPLISEEEYRELKPADQDHQSMMETGDFNEIFKKQNRRVDFSKLFNSEQPLL